MIFEEIIESAQEDENMSTKTVEILMFLSHVAGQMLELEELLEEG